MRLLALALPALFAVACSTPAERPTTLPNCETCDASVPNVSGGGGSGGGGGGSLDAGSGPGGDASVPTDGALRFEVARGDGGVALTGRVRVAQGFPLTETTPYVAGAGWNLETFPASLNELTSSDAAGRFAFANASYITVNGTGPLLGLRFAAPRMGSLASFVLLPPLRDVEVTGIDSLTLQDALSPAMGTLLPGRGHIIVQVQLEAAPRGPARDTVVTAVNAPFAQTYYDGPQVGQLVLSLTGTGAYGFAVIPNLDAPPAPGYAVARLRLTRNGVSVDYAAPVFTDTVTWVALSPRS